MGGKKSPTLPDVPSMQFNQIAQETPGILQGFGNMLTSPNLLKDPVLGEAVNLNPDITRLMLGGLQAQLAGPLQQNRQDTINQLEANNQLTGSTTASALGNIDQNYQNQLVSAGANAGIADINRALSNRVSLFGTGLNTLQAAGQAGLNNQNATNQFNLENYQNQVAKVLGEQKQQSGGLFGGAMGAIGGAIGGFALGGPAGAGIGAIGGGLTGAFSPQGTGGALFQSGAGLAGSKLGNNQYNPTNNAYSLSGAVAPESIYGGLGGYTPRFSAGGWI